jgi:type II secretory pathway component PulM
MNPEGRMQKLRDRWERLSSRERTMVAAMGVTFVLMVTLIVGFVITDGLSTFEEKNSDMRQALKDLDTKRQGYLAAKNKLQQLEARIGRNPIQLGGYLEQAAKESGVEIPESNERQPTPAGKQYIEKSIELRLRAVKLDSLGKFLKKVETGPNLVVVTALNVRTRDDKHQDLDVEMTVSTYEHAPQKDPKKTGGKPDKGDKP